MILKEEINFANFLLDKYFYGYKKFEEYRSFYNSNIWNYKIEDNYFKIGIVVSSGFYSNNIQYPASVTIEGKISWFGNTQSYENKEYQFTSLAQMMVFVVELINRIKELKKHENNKN